jgi:hypothetical protein
MARYYQKFFASADPRPFSWLVHAGIALRFLVLAAIAVVRQGVSRVLGR